MRDGLTEARRKADELLGQKETESISARDKERQAQDAKIARLRALRLAKEASENATDTLMRQSKRERKTV